jgi:hypothetical protein
MSEPDPTADVVPPQRRVTRVLDTVAENPYGYFILNEIQAGVSGLAVYAIFCGVAWATQYFTPFVPLDEARPAKFVVTALSWGGAISASGIIVITIFHFIILLRRLWKDVQS